MSGAKGESTDVEDLDFWRRVWAIQFKYSISLGIKNNKPFSFPDLLRQVLLLSSHLHLSRLQNRWTGSKIFVSSLESSQKRRPSFSLIFQRLHLTSFAVIASFPRSQYIVSDKSTAHQVRSEYLGSSCSKSLFRVSVNVFKRRFLFLLLSFCRLFRILFTRCCRSCGLRSRIWFARCVFRRWLAFLFRINCVSN